MKSNLYTLCLIDDFIGMFFKKIQKRKVIKENNIHVESE